MEEIENKAANYFENLGFNCLNLEPGGYDQLYDNLSTATARRLQHNISEEKLGKGVPDLLVFKESSDGLSVSLSNYFFVEVKSSKDSLRKSQFSWIRKYSDENVLLAWCNDTELEINRIELYSTNIIQNKDITCLPDEVSH